MSVITKSLIQSNIKKYQLKNLVDNKKIYDKVQREVWNDEPDYSDGFPTQTIEKQRSKDVKS